MRAIIGADYIVARK
jgi:hypothetical protein